MDSLNSKRIASNIINLHLHIMSSIDRRDRIKVKVHKDILDAAMKIIKEEGSNSLIIRKIADMIEYSLL